MKIECSCFVPFLRVPFFHMFMQTLSVRHTCCHQQSSSSRQIDNNHGNTNGLITDPIPPSSTTSSVCSSQCLDSCTKSSQPSPSLPFSSFNEDHSKTTQSHLQYDQPNQTNYSDLINVNSNSAKHVAANVTKSHSTRVRFIDSSTSTEPSSLSLLFEQSAHISDPMRSNHVI